MFCNLKTYVTSIRTLSSCCSALLDLPPTQASSYWTHTLRCMCGWAGGHDRTVLSCVRSTPPLETPTPSGLGTRSWPWKLHRSTSKVRAQHLSRNLKLTCLFLSACKRTRTPRGYVVMAGTEHERFKNTFPFWEDDKSVQEINCKVSLHDNVTSSYRDFTLSLSCCFRVHLHQRGLI